MFFQADYNYNWYDVIYEIDFMNGLFYIVEVNFCGLSSFVFCDDYNYGIYMMGMMIGIVSDEGKSIGVVFGVKWIVCCNMECGYGSLVFYIECFEWFLAFMDLNGENLDFFKVLYVIVNFWSCFEIEGCMFVNFEIMQIVVDNFKVVGVVVVVFVGNSGSQCYMVSIFVVIFENSFIVGVIW